MQKGRLTTNGVWKMRKRAVFFPHILGWVLYISYELSLVEITVGLSATVIHYSVYYLLNIALFYFNAHVILDFSFFRTSRPYIFACLLILAEIFCYLIFKLFLDALISGKEFTLTWDVNHQRLWITNIWREIFFIGFSTAYWSLLYMIRFKERNHAMETDRLKALANTLELENRFIAAENAYLQNQISPHLLFNSLSFIYNAVHKLSDKAGKGVMLLADIMRYSLVSSQDNRMVALKQEIEQLEKLIEISRLRFGEELHIQFKRQGARRDIRIPPLILITLIENMIKHGDLGDPDRPALIRLQRKDQTLLFTTWNAKRGSDFHPKNGMGLQNMEKRLNNFYQDRFSLMILNGETDFKVTLSLPL